MSKMSRRIDVIRETIEFHESLHDDGLISVRSARYLLNVIDALQEAINTANQYINATYPILENDCEANGTCGDCLADNRGTHTDQARQLIRRWNSISSDPLVYRGKLE